MEKQRRFLKKSMVSLLAAMILLFLSKALSQQKEPEVPYVPTPDIVVQEMLKMAQVSKNDVLYDLGCGDGRIVITAAREFGCRGVGIDIDPERIRESRENARLAGVSDKVRFIEMDLFEAKISEATVVTLYLLTEVNLRLRPKLLRELNPGTRVVSHEFAMGEWIPEATSTVRIENYRDSRLVDYWAPYTGDFWDNHAVYLWIIPANVNGTWELTAPGLSGKNKFTLILNHEFQQVRGQAFVGTSPAFLYIEDEKIKGNKLRFTIERKKGRRSESIHFDGRVKGIIMQGTLKIEGSSGIDKIRWKARRVVSTFRPIENKLSASKATL